MKNIGNILIVLLVTLFGASTPVLAVSVADSTATLAAHVTESDSRANLLRLYLSSFNSPFADQANHFVSEADRLGLDWRLVAAISGVESTFGKQVPRGSFNAWGWGSPSPSQWIAFADWKTGITTVSEGLKGNYVDKGARTINQIGRIYAASPAWSWRVRYFIEQITEFRPSASDLLAVTI